MKFWMRSKRIPAFGRDRLHHVGEGAVCQTMLPLFFERNDLHRNVPGLWIQLEVVEHGPPEHVGQEDIERDAAAGTVCQRRAIACPRVATMPLNPLSRASPSKTRA